MHLISFKIRVGRWYLIYACVYFQTPVLVIKLSLIESIPKVLVDLVFGFW